MADTTEKIIIEVEEKGVSETTRAMDSLNESIEENQEATEQMGESQEEYNKSLGDTIKDTKIMGVSMNSLSASFKATTGAIRASTSGLKLFKVALAATGIGLLVLALGSLVTFFTRSQEGADMLSKALRVIGNVINVLLDRLSDFGGGLVKLFSGDIRGGLSDMKNSFIGIGDAIQENIERAIELERQMIQLREASLNLTIQEAAYRQRIAESREVMNDTNQLMSDRLQAGRDALKFENQLADARIFNLNLQKTMMEEGLSESKTRHEDLQEIANLEAQLIQAETARALGSIKLRNRLQGLEKEALKIRQEDEEQAQLLREERQAEIDQADATRRGEIQAERVTGFQEVADKELEIQTDLTAALGRLQDKQANDAKEASDFAREFYIQNAELTADAAEALFGGLAALAGQNSEFGKASAIAQAIINTWRGVGAVLADGTLPTIAKIGFIAATVAQGLAAVRQIQSTPLPKVQAVETVFSEGGHINGASHQSPAGGVRILAEGGEFIMNKKSMGIPGVAGLMETINSLGARGASQGLTFAQGGYVPSNLEQLNLEAAIQAQRPVLVLEDFFSEVNTIQVSEELSSL